MVTAQGSEHRHSCCGAQAFDDQSAKSGSQIPIQSESDRGHEQSAHGQDAHESHAKDSGSRSRAVKDGVRDPVCGMTVDPHATPHRGQYAGRKIGRAHV